jgi:hypothetical protein
MKNKLHLLIVMIVSVFTTLAIPAYATPKNVAEAEQAILNMDSRFYKTNEKLPSYYEKYNPNVDVSKSEDAIYGNPVQESNVSYSIQTVINQLFRDCDIMEAYVVCRFYYVNDPNSYRFVLYEDQINTLMEHQNAIDDWSSSSIREIVPDGIGMDDAIKICYLHILRNYPYNRNATSRVNLDLNKQAQGAYYAITTQSGICASLSKLFRTLVEAIPFDPETGCVNYNAESPFNLKVAIIDNEYKYHEWAAIQMSGNWYYYDCAMSNDFVNQYMNDEGALLYYYKMTDEGLIENYYGDAKDYIWYY